MIRVVTTDLETGDSESAEFDNDYVIVCAGRCYLHHVQRYKNGTTILTVKTDSEPASPQSDEQERSS